MIDRGYWTPLLDAIFKSNFFSLFVYECTELYLLFISMFAVIEFSPGQGGGLSLINRKWLTPRKKEVFWPPYKDQVQFTRSIRKSEEVNPDTWKIYNVQRIFFETDDYAQALDKLKKAEETSDLQTSDYEGDNLGKRKRKKYKPTKLFDSISTDDEEESILPSPPSVERTLVKSATSTISNGQKCKEPKIGTPVTVSNPKNSDKCATPSSSKNFLSLPSTTHSTNGVLIQTPTVLPGCSNSVGLCSVTEKSAFQVLLENVLEVKNQNKIILAKICKLEKAEAKTALEIPVKLPLKTAENLENLEIFLQEKNNSDLLISYFSGLGGTNVSSKTNRILKETIDDTLATSFNYFGRNNKNSFAKLRLCTCIIDAVKSSGCTTVHVEGAIKTWLKRAPQRNRKQQPADAIHGNQN